MTIVDTHAHIYHGDEIRYPMIEKPSRPPETIGTIEHLRQNMLESGTNRVVLVQTGSAYLWDNRLLADTSLANSADMTGVCNLNALDEGSVAELERLATRFNVRGLRLEPTKEAAPRYHHPGAERLFEKAQSLGVVICAHINIAFAGELATLLEKYPEVPVVFDHSGYLAAEDAQGTDKLTTVMALARYKNLYTKLSFGVTGSSLAYPFEDTHAVIRQIIDTYGPDRCIWGSDFPCEHWLKKSTFNQHLEMFTDAMGLSTGEKQAILSDTPMKLWFG